MLIYKLDSPDFFMKLLSIGVKLSTNSILFSSCSTSFSIWFFWFRFSEINPLMESSLDACLSIELLTSAKRSQVYAFSHKKLHFEHGDMTHKWNISHAIKHFVFSWTLNLFHCDLLYAQPHRNRNKNLWLKGSCFQRVFF